MENLVRKWTESSLILRILCGLGIGTILGIIFKKNDVIGFPGELFIKALRGIAPILVFTLVASNLSRAGEGIGNRFKIIIILYMISTFLSAIIAVCANYIFPVKMPINETKDKMLASSDNNNLGDILKNIFLNIVENPLVSLSQGGYLGILFYAIIIGYCLKKNAKESTLNILTDISDVISLIVRGIIQFAPIGIMCLIYTAVAENGIKIFYKYGKLILLDVSCVFIVAFITNPFIVFILLRRNPYPLILTCLKESGITAFLTRSSAANIPVNLRLCEKLGLDKDFYSVSIPLGSTINMGGSAITISVMTLTLCNKLGIHVSIDKSIVLTFISTLAACGTSGVSGGSLLLIPMACSLFGISDEDAEKAIHVGFIIDVIQDSCATALNSSSDVVFTATADYYEKNKEGEKNTNLREIVNE